jgi:hypothetical protein
VGVPAAQDPARVGELHAPGISLEKARPDSLLELTYLAAERLLGEVKPLRCTREVEFLGNR